MMIRLALALLLCSGTVVAADRPNILFILTDDQAPETLSAYGNQICHTPNIDRIAREGIRLDDAHHMGAWSGAVCTPSRTMIMTGRCVWNIPGAHRLDSPEAREAEAAKAAETSMPAVFHAAGYDTFRTCKKGNTFKAASQLFDINVDEDKRGASPEAGSAWHADRALEFLRERAETGDQDPFLLYLGFSHPHDPRNGTPELLEKYGAMNCDKPPTTVNKAAPPLQANYLPVHPFPHPHGHLKLRDEDSVSGVLTDRSEATIRNEQGREYACIENIDRQIGRVLAMLESMGELDNTYVIFTADHGIAVGRHGLTGKQNLYEHTWRVPFLVRGPGIAPGSSASGYIYLMDVLPTMCDLAGIEIPDTVDGTSFRPVLEGKKNRIRDAMYGVYCGGTKPGIRSVKRDGWKLIKYDVLDGAVRETQLFNVRENPFELLAEHHTPEVIATTGNVPKPGQVNLADNPEFAAKRQELEDVLISEEEKWGDPYRLWDQPELADSP